MSTKEEYKIKILKNLNGQSLNLKKLTKLVNKDLSKLKLEIRDKQFKEALMDLLIHEKIRLVGYDFSVYDIEEKNKDGTPRIQSEIKLEGIKLRRVITDDIHIHSLLKQLNDNKQFKKAKDELETIFNRKYGEYIKQENEFYNSLIPRVKCSPAKEIYEKNKQYLQSIAQEIYENNKEKLKDMLHSNAKQGQEWRYIMPPRLKKDETLESVVGPHIKGVLSYINNLRMELYDIYSEFKVNDLSDESKVWYMPNITMDEVWKVISNKYSIRTGFQGPILDVSDEIIGDKTREEFRVKMRLVDVKGELTKESYIKKWKFIPELSEDRLFGMFNDILFYVNTHENHEVLENHLSFALSDRKGSLNYFELFVKITLSEPFYLRFQKDLGIK
jgi:hypothetical protein